VSFYWQSKDICCGNKIMLDLTEYDILRHAVKHGVPRDYAPQISVKRGVPSEPSESLRDAPLSGESRRNESPRDESRRDAPRSGESRSDEPCSSESPKVPESRSDESQRDEPCSSVERGVPSEPPESPLAPESLRDESRRDAPLRGESPFTAPELMCRQPVKENCLI